MSLGRNPETLNLEFFQVGSYRYRSFIEGLYTLKKPYGNPKIPQNPELQVASPSASNSQILKAGSPLKGPSTLNPKP